MYMQVPYPSSLVVISRAVDELMAVGDIHELNELLGNASGIEN